jgi:hypothetical protein
MSIGIALVAPIPNQLTAIRKPMPPGGCGPVWLAGTLIIRFTFP